MAGPSNPRRRVAMPARVLESRLLQLDDMPEWAAYLPAKLRQELRTGRHVPAFPPGFFLQADVPACALAGQVANGYWWRGRVWTLSRDQTGCRKIQLALDSDSEAERVELVGELRGKVYEATRCPHANYVLQKAVSVLRPRQLNFILEELDSKGPSGIEQVARHKYGCRIVQRLLEHGSPEQADLVASSLLVDAVGNCVHPYGNYAMQKFLEIGPAHLRRDLVDLLIQDVALLGTDSYGTSVLSKLLSCGSKQEQRAVLLSMLGVPGLLMTASQIYPGDILARVAMKVLEGAELEQARLQLAGGLGGQPEWQWYAHAQALGTNWA